uniref:Trafficking protein particle complex subunit n=1 Tax=Odontella aurita TaxID=265563 RepID=A0A6U6GZU1_9STRA|mmetsp:Transcript_44553/g.135783  ORF Transcript_44553/g.135783 Transcript_44553/m.135783 type:complete len:180 (+) Transcript_44553:164-703(+)|eukprot:CAMPEP_0113561238 /NCGR_PEP_ID=MMETSP0015_2-20120614/19870_1 /TAXON_ID=2838 /ORGANISM="Odontella" /LENGTH=179 /DNA_ID=CAMNT_0000463021 /DNA_START=93 /DNA_END=632 /DNA_ORIENTATION=+ /assembly_acc=CAM_ASM_000160
MPIHSLNIFDRRGKTLFTKTYSSAAAQQQQQLQANNTSDEDPLSEQRKLVFGMLFSLRELVGSLTPEDEPAALHSIRTGASTIHNYETSSGLRFSMFATNDADGRGGPDAPAIRDALRHIYTDIWVETVVRSPLYRPGNMLSADDMDRGPDFAAGKFDIRSTNFEKKLDSFLQSMPWFR